MKNMTDVFIAKKDDRPRISDFLKEHPEIEENFGKWIAEYFINNS